MTTTQTPPEGNERYWHEFMSKAGLHTLGRSVFERLPGQSRCSTCATPFDGIGARFMALIGRDRHEHDEICSGCVAEVAAHPGGAEIEASVVIARFEGTADRAPRFDDDVTQIVLDHKGIVDQRSEGGISAFFAPALCKERHPAFAVAMARALLGYTPCAVGVHTGRVRVGMLDGNRLGHITVVGDVVDTTGGLAGLAGAEILVSAAAAESSALVSGQHDQVVVGDATMDVVRLVS